MLATDLIAFARATLPPPPARVLEVGAGDGELAAALSAAGHEVVAIDPASETESVRRVALHELDEAPFDAAVAVTSLHHVEPLAESLERLAALVRPGGVLVVDEIDFERFDVGAARWWLERSGHPGEPADLLGSVHHMHPLRRLRDELSRWFDVGTPVRGPYLYRWNMQGNHAKRFPTDVRAEEEAAIAAGDLQATGARLAGVRRP